MVDRSHIYRVYRDGVYLGTLDPISEFGYEQEINTSAARLTIEVANTIDLAGESVEELLTESGETLDTESGEALLLQSQIDDIGAKDSGALIANYNDIVVTEISADNPNGVTVLSGYIASWQTVLGAKTTTLVDVFSNGDDIDDYIYGNQTTVAQITQTSEEVPADWISLTTSKRWGQTFTPGTSYDILVLRAKFMISSFLDSHTSATVTCKIYSGTPSGFTSPTVLASATVNITSIYPSDSDGQVADFTFSVPASVVSGQVYYMEFTTTARVFISWDENGNPYANGSMYQYDSGLGGWYSYGGGNDDLYFIIYSGTMLTDATFTATDPAAMVTETIDGYQSQGGNATYTALTVPATTAVSDYEFKMATVREIIQKARDLAPAGTYWYIDPATTVLTFKQVESEPEHTFLLGKHFESLELGSTVENIANVAYFTGGPTAGVNLLKRYTDDDSLLINRRGMVRLFDNRVTDTDTAEALSDAYMAEHNDEVFRSEITVLADTYDISTISLGQAVGFGGLNNFADPLVLQITSLRRRPDYVTLTLGELPLKRETYIDQLNRNLDQVSTLDNPSGPA